MDKSPHEMLTEEDMALQHINPQALEKWLKMTLKDSETKIAKEEKEKFQEKIVELKDTQRELESDINTLHLYSKKLDEDRVIEKDKRCKLEEDILDQTENHEAEVQLRLLLETKINTLHSINRKLSQNYNTALSTTESTRADNQLLKTANKDLRDQIGQLKLDLVETSEQVKSQQHKIDGLASEILYKNELVSSLTERLQHSKLVSSNV
ncbi:unnamed protein product [Moneuplotes crassus]|uniref:Uncharacterized protein n=1 Tax=Euplotes crassus TaxID=5936 RepID=A0AAD2DAP2_EUPCR|nr:unnamed protein product [Moneuplotes crassus]